MVICVKVIFYFHFNEIFSEIIKQFFQDHLNLSRLNLCEQ